MKNAMRESIDFPVINCAVVVDGTAVRICMNAVKSTPVRVISAEEVLKGREITEETAEEAVTAGFKETEVLADNEYKITLAKVMLKRAILACK